MSREEFLLSSLQSVLKIEVRKQKITSQCLFFRSRFRKCDTGCYQKSQKVRLLHEDALIAQNMGR